MKFWANEADKIWFCCTLGLGLDFGRTVKAISSTGIRIPCQQPKGTRISSSYLSHYMLPLSDFHLLCVPHEIKNDTFYNRVEATICQGHSLISSEGVQTKQTNKWIYLQLCLFVQGWCSCITHACLTNQIHICRVPHSLDPTPRPGGCIIGRGHESSEVFWTGLIYLVVLNPIPAWGMASSDWGLPAIIIYPFEVQDVDS